MIGSERTVSELLTTTKWWQAERKLARFRRHPDWIKAFKKMAKLFVIEVPDGSGRRAICEENIRTIFELADEEFADEIIRHEGETP